MPETAKRTARVPILGEDGRIPDDYIPAAIGEGVESAEAAATRAETAATAAEGSAAAASQSAAGAQGSASAAGTSATQAQQSATAASGAATQAQSAQQAAEAAKAGAESARDSAQTAASQAQQSAASVVDKYITSAQATTLEPGSQATASVADQVLTIGVPKGEKGDKGDKGDTGDQGVQGDKGDPGTAATIAVGSVTGLAAGAPPTVVNSGTAHAAVLDFGIPKGDKGEKGDPGTTPTVVAAEGSDLSVSTDEGTVTIDDSALRARITELENQAANVVTGTSTGLVAHGEDAFPQKPIEVRVKGKTWVNRWPQFPETQTTNGVTLTCDETGLFTISGTASSFIRFAATPQGIGQNKNVAILISAPLGDGATAVLFSGKSTVIASASDTNLHKGNTGSFETITAAIQVTSGTTVNTSFRVMLVDGTEAPDCFTPPASIASVQTGELVTAGKNLINTDGASVLENNFGVKLPKLTLQPGSYVVKSPSGLTDNLAIYRDGDMSSPISSITENGKPFAITSPVHGIDFRSAEANQVTLDNISQFQLELGSTATSYEPPTVTTTPLPEVELRSLPNSTCDELVIKADGTCEVERKTGYIASYTDEEVTGEYVSTGNGLEAGASIVYELDEPTTEPQSPVTLPALPAPTFNQYHDADVPSDTSTEYVRDINIVLANLEAVQTALLGLDEGSDNA